MPFLDPDDEQETELDEDTRIKQLIYNIGLPIVDKSTEKDKHD